MDWLLRSIPKKKEGRKGKKEKKERKEW